MKLILNKIIITVLILTACCCDIFSQHIVSVPFPGPALAEKLSANELKLFYQDREGFIWMSTGFGLAQYDGYEVREFRNNFLHPNLLADNEVECLSDDNHFVWVGTQNGVSLVDKRNMKISLLQDKRLQGGMIRDILTDKNNKTWVAYSNPRSPKPTYRVVRCNNDGMIEKVYPVRHRPNALYIDQHGVLWVMADGSVFRFDKGRGRFVCYPFDKNPYRMVQDKKGNYWLATWNDGIYRFCPNGTEGKRFTKQTITNPARHLPDQTFYDIVQDDVKGYLWALSHFRLYILRQTGDNKLEPVSPQEISGGLSGIEEGRMYNRIFKDRDKNLWLAAYDRSCVLFFKNGIVHNYLLDDIRKVLGNEGNIVDIQQDQSGIIWMNQGRYGLFLYDMKSGKSELGSTDKFLYSIDGYFMTPSKDGGMWVAGRYKDEGNIYKLRQRNMRVSQDGLWELKKHVPDLGRLNGMQTDKDGNLWITTDKKILIIPHNGTKPIIYDGIKNGIRSVCSYNKGEDICVYTSTELLSGTYTHGGIKMRKLNWEGFKLRGGDDIENVTIDRYGHFWIVTKLCHVLRLDPNRGGRLPTSLRKSTLTVVKYSVCSRLGISSGRYSTNASSSTT